MAGQPIKRALVAQLEKQAAESSEDRGEALTALDVVYEWVAAGRKTKELVQALAKAAGVRVSENAGGSILTTWVHGQDGGREMMDRARGDAAHALAQEALEIVDEADEDKTALNKAKLQADQRNWLASRWNRKAYGQDTASIALNLDLGGLHIDALRQRKLEDAVPQPAVEGEDYEVLPALPPAGESAARVP
jgi:hypothetical protein